MRCDGCNFEFEIGELKLTLKGSEEFHFCEFCANSFISNATMYPTMPDNRMILRTIAFSHNIIIEKLKEMERKLEKSRCVCRKSSSV